MACHLENQAKGIDIALASVTAELGFLANPVSTHVQSAEMANQAVNSLALISARYTIKSVECLSMLQAWSLYLLCQAFDLRAIQRQIYTVLEDQIQRSISAHFSTWIDGPNQRALATRVFVRISKRLDETSARDLRARLSDAYMAAAEELVEHFTSLPSGGGADPLRSIWAWRAASASETHDLHRKLTLQYLQDPKGCHASPLLGKTARLYEFVRRTLGVPMHGMNNFVEFKGEQGEMRETIGGYVSVIYESIRNGDLYAVMIEMLKDVQATSGASLPTSRL